MLRFIARRVAQALGVVALAATLAFALLHLAPGDPLTDSLERAAMDEGAKARWRATYGLDRPLPEQYARWLLSVARGDLGWSFSQQRPVAEVLRDALPNTLLLVGVALLVAIPAGVAIGATQAAARTRGDARGRAADRALGVATLVTHSVPEYWLALGALALLAYRIPLFPAGGMLDPVSHDYLPLAGRILDRLRHLVLPVGVLALALLTTVARHQRAALVEVLGEDHVRTARAKGIGERAVLGRHALRNALLPVITLLGLALPALVGGAVFVERVFAWPGMGLVAVQGVEGRDYPLVTATVVVGSACVAMGGLLADVLHAWADPRVREGLIETPVEPT